MPRRRGPSSPSARQGDRCFRAGAQAAFEPATLLFRLVQAEVAPAAVEVLLGAGVDVADGEGAAFTLVRRDPHLRDPEHAAVRAHYEAHYAPPARRLRPCGVGFSEGKG